MAELVLDVLSDRVSRYGAKPFLRHEGRVLSYSDFDVETNRAANLLLRLGLEKGERATLALGNRLEYLVLAFGILKAGGVFHPINPALGDAELSYVLGHAEPRVVFARAEDRERIARVAPKARVVAAGAELAELLREASPEPPPVRVTAEDASTLLYTSGTTGTPKGVLFRHRSTGAAGRHFLEALRIVPEDTILAVTPLFHGNAWGAAVTALQAGATFAFPETFHASRFWPLVHECRATVLYTLGTILAILLQQEPSELERTNPLRVVLGLGSAPVRDEVLRRFGVEHVAECYGSTDAGVVTITPFGASPRPGSAGPPVPGVEVRILDDEGRELPLGEVGEICVRSPHRLAEYFRDPEETHRAFFGEWFRTGDLGYLDRDGWLYFVDRKKDVIRRGGENISSVLVEKTLREHPAVAEVAVVGVPDPVLGQEVKAFVVPRAPVTEEELRAFASARLARFQVPRFWEFRDSLPKTSTQRVEKYKLREEASRGRKPLLG